MNKKAMMALTGSLTLGLVDYTHKWT